MRGRWWVGGIVVVVAVIGAVVWVMVHRIRQEHVKSKTGMEEKAVVYAAEKKVLPSPLAGRWYEASKDRLGAELDGYFAKANPPIEGVQALILPHAGYRYSGAVAAMGIKAAAGRKYERVIVLGPSHRVPLPGTISLPAATHYSTPLGETALDLEFIAALEKYPFFRTVPATDEVEHSVQIQLPLLQRALGEFKLVPLVVGQLDEDETISVGKILAGLVDSDTLVVASSDFTHYGPNYDYVPFKDDVVRNLESLDMGAWACIQRKDGAEFARYIDKTDDTICGRYPIGILLAMLPKKSEAHLIKYDTSGHITGDFVNSVSYLSIAFTGMWEKGDRVQAPAAAAVTAAEVVPLTNEDKTQLLALARGMLETYVRSGHTASEEEFGIKVTPGMGQTMGAFVTLKEKGELRGCIGEIFPRRALYKAVMEHAIDAGVHDPRFRPVTAAELPALEYEISALTQPKAVASYEDIVIGKHGMTIEKEGRMAVFLPQVAPEQGWDLATTLTHLSQKAGLPGNAWKEGASFNVFEAIVFHEEKK